MFSRQEASIGLSANSSVRRFFAPFPPGVKEESTVRYPSADSLVGNFGGKMVYAYRGHVDVFGGRFFRSS